jgi:hypothetical protein
MDLYAIAPVFHGGELIGFVGNITHHTDLGGVAAGGVVSATSTRSTVTSSTARSRPTPLKRTTASSLIVPR